jgi:hypothetical protein
MRAALVGASSSVLCALLGASLASAEPAPPAAPSRSSESDDFELSARADTHAALFRRALLPGPNGSLVDTESAAPLHEYVTLRARRLDVGSWHDALALEVSAWGRLWPTSARFEPTLDGDVQTAVATLRHGSILARIGRQHAAGGAARYSRFDGVMLGTNFTDGLEGELYAGLTVLPRISSRLGYHHLGSEGLALVVDDEALEATQRPGHWLAGGRFGYVSPELSAMASFHEQRQAGELGRRSVGLDARANLRPASLQLSALLDVDSARLADARAWAYLTPLEALTVSLELLHTEPALWLSRQSVLSVFSTDRLDEAGGSATLDLSEGVRVEGAAYLTLGDERRPGARSEGTLRFAPDARSLLRLSYVRVVAPKNGYHSLRSSLSRRWGRTTLGTLEAYAYLYDRAIAAYRSSSVYAATLSRGLGAWNMLVGGSLARTPHAGLDAQAQLRVSYSFDQVLPEFLP